MHRALEELVGHTGGIIGRRQYPELGSRIDRAVRCGELIGILPGVFVVPELRSDWRARAEAVAWWDDDAVITHEAAAALTFWPELRPRAVGVSTRRVNLRRPGFVFHRSAVPPECVVTVARSRVASPALTALDLVATHQADAIDVALRSRTATLDGMRRALDLVPHRRGNGDRRRALFDSRAEPWSAAERLAHRQLRAAGITRWHANVPFVCNGHQYFLDIDMDDCPVVVEVDGQVHRRRDIFESDRRRGNELLLAGKRVLHFTWRMLVEEPDWFISTTRRALDAWS